MEYITMHMPYQRVDGKFGIRKMNQFRRADILYDEVFSRAIDVEWRCCTLEGLLPRAVYRTEKEGEMVGVMIYQKRRDEFKKKYGIRC